MILLGPVAQSEASPAVHQGFVSSIATQPKSIISWRLVTKTDIYKYFHSPPSADSRRVLVSFKWKYVQKVLFYTPIPHRARIPRIATDWQIFGFVGLTYSVREDLNNNWIIQSVVSSCNSWAYRELGSKNLNCSKLGHEFADSKNRAWFVTNS